MQTNKHFSALLVVILSLVFCASAGIAMKKDPLPKVFHGYLMDKMCSKRMVGNTEKMMKHSKTCLTEDMCASSGYGLMTEKKFIPFDAKGNELAAKYLAATPKEKDFMIEVTGSMKKNKLAVTNLTDVSPQK